jgi:hypothetical protein
MHPCAGRFTTIDILAEPPILSDPLPVSGNTCGVVAWRRIEAARRRRVVVYALAKQAPFLLRNCYCLGAAECLVGYASEWRRVSGLSDELRTRRLDAGILDNRRGVRVAPHQK